MSAQHTKGRLIAVHNVLLIDSRVAEFPDVASLVGIENAEANARRLAACWNACEGISTENLEDNAPIIELANRYNAALRQRDELLRTLKMVMPALNALRKQCPRNPNDDSLDVVQFVHAVIDKVESSQK